MTVEPPTQAPAYSVITRPAMPIWYRRAVISASSPVKSLVSRRGPASSTITPRPDSASVAATGAPPAPLPITTASAESSTECLYHAGSRGCSSERSHGKREPRSADETDGIDIDRRRSRTCDACDLDRLAERPHHLER